MSLQVRFITSDRSFRGAAASSRWPLTSSADHYWSGHQQQHFCTVSSTFAARFCRSKLFPAGWTAAAGRRFCSRLSLWEKDTLVPNTPSTRARTRARTRAHSHCTQSNLEAFSSCSCENITFHSSFSCFWCMNVYFVYFSLILLIYCFIDPDQLLQKV